MRWIQPDRTVLSAWAAAGVGLPLLLACIPPFHVLNHEFAGACTLAHAFGLYFLAARTTRAAAGEREDDGNVLLCFDAAVYRTMGQGLVWAVTALAVIGIATAARQECRWLVGLPYFLSTWLPACLFMVVLGALVGARTRGALALWGVLALVIGVMIGHDVAQPVFGPRGEPVDPLLGGFAGSNQRALMAVSEIHLRERVLLLFATGTLWFLARWRVGRGSRDRTTRLAASHARAWFGGSALVLISLVAFAADEFGLGWGRRALHRDLSRTHFTEHFEIRYPDSPAAAASIRAIARRAEWYWHDLVTGWAFEPEGRVRLYVFDRPTDLRRHASYTHATLRAAYLMQHEARDSTLLHELVHALNITWDPSLWVITSRGLLEGLAMAYEHDYAYLPEAHELQAAALAADRLPSATRFMSVLGFQKVHEGSGYRAAGSFVGFLILEYGFDRFLTLERTFDYEKAYGMDLAALDGAWREFLREVPLSSSARFRSFRYFDPTTLRGYLSAACPKVGGRERVTVTRARQAFDLARYGVALPAFLQLWKEDGEFSWLLWALNCHDRLGEIPEGLDLIETALAGENLGESDRANLLYWKTRFLLRAREWSAVHETLDQRAEGGRHRSEREVLERACLLEPAVRDRAAEVLTAKPSQDRRYLWEELIAHAPDFGPSYLLYAHDVLRGPFDLRRRHEALRRFTELSPEHAHLAAPDLLRLGEEAWAAEDHDLAGEAFRLAREASRNPLHTFRASRGLEQVQFDSRGVPGQVPR